VAEHTDAVSAVAQHRRGDVRTHVVWEALRTTLQRQQAAAPERALDVLDLGGGTGGFAVRVAAAGHRVTVVDPSPDALASLARRAAESEVSDRVRGVQGDAADLLDVVPPRSADVVLCHGVLEVVDDPEQAVRGVGSVLRTGGRLSLLVAQRHAVVLARVVAGHLGDAERLLAAADEGPSGATPRRFTEAELTALLTGTGFDVETVHGIRVFTDIVPGAIVDAEPGTVDALLRLEADAAERPEYRSLATQLHLVAQQA
jgi:S-adenosylmethionine-dependent methyltransferase